MRGEKGMEGGREGRERRERGREEGREGGREGGREREGKRLRGKGRGEKAACQYQGIPPVLRYLHQKKHYPPFHFQVSHQTVSAP